MANISPEVVRHNWNGSIIFIAPVDRENVLFNLKNPLLSNIISKCLYTFTLIF